MSYHGRIMNIAARDKYAGVLAMKAVRVSYHEGHRDARHAAAEIATEADGVITELVDTIWQLLYSDVDNHIPDALHKRARAVIAEADFVIIRRKR